MTVTCPWLNKCNAIVTNYRTITAQMRYCTSNKSLPLMLVKADSCIFKTARKKWMCLYSTCKVLSGKVKWCIYIVPFSCNMLRGALQWSVYPQRTGSVYRHKWQPLQISPCMLVLILLTPEWWKAECTLAGKKVTQMFNPRPSWGSNWGPQVCANPSAIIMQ